KDFRDLGWCESPADVFGMIWNPVHDIDFFAAEFLHHRLHSGALHADARAYGIDIRIVRSHSDFGPATRFPRRTFHFDDAFVNFGDLLGEQLDQPAWVGARWNDLRPSAGDLYADDVSPDAVALPVPFARHLLLFGKDCIGTAKIDNDVTLLETLDDAVDKLPFATLKLVVDNLPLGIPQSLDNVLFGGLRGNSPEQARIELAQQFVANLRIGIEIFLSVGQGNLRGFVLDLGNDSFSLEQLHFADLRVELCLDFSLMAELFLRRRNHRVFESADENRF